ncbi:MAG: hypothetical protein A3C50_02850 [Candidatus Staskawiczbacteria bacterium RIFCSPHIGHO2_02_FULL_43_16]|uniref:Histidine phosphatase family protein n=1 Tax=Candidatus Staskawiczbacteria bacterium RIFCSPHIGHO2_01_FULL_41_41 TaxID=1802203 RepID=A0A1G2HSV7_9BACT|nr:MAG: hypothetical protein A2822_03470 [Candidatus Staskawiczbacteria bacterium RIFCSPHIGHO2_01_FULL_41_41]OGZ68218.1 MAG: hypothetical protein A3C50_02850 [Candidatus Staskawiczbacteria bacterium RIFCSPHIGHO2_02_FULL_43_16]OGZ75007.1 MAG: hypothetical protein A3A12_04250 [Candidatus Staskawiczbacteria bacterium RIFCSPLOWO2_01_FULL_43_17b]
MNKLIFVRYGEHTDQHLNEVGIKAMILVAEKLKHILENQNVGIVCAEVPRAVESAHIISETLNVPPAKHFAQLYASEDAPIYLTKAVEVIDSAGGEHDVLIAVVSREYIETLPNFILQSLGVEKPIETHLERGEILVLDYSKKEITYLR